MDGYPVQLSGSGWISAILPNLAPSVVHVFHIGVSVAGMLHSQ